MQSCSRLIGGLVAAVLAAVPGVGFAQNAAGDWPMYNRDLNGTRYSPLNQINAGNVATLKQAWEYKLGPKPGGITGGWESTPIVVDGVMYMPAGDSNVVALDAATGKEMWKYSISNGEPSRRGVSYWPGAGNVPPRIFVTAGRRLIAVNAVTGEPVAAFGTQGEIDMVIPYESAPVIFKDKVLVGTNGNPGGTRAFDARTGAKLWEFNSIPRSATDPGADTWLNESWRNRPGGTQWQFSMTVDAELNSVYATYDAPGPNDYWGGDRPGINLFGSSVVALDADTGKMKWYHQAVHHDLWDYDFPSPAALVDVTVNGQRVPALVAMTKAAVMWILDRRTGKPLFGMEERPVAQSTVPGEWTSPTQPYPLKPPVLARDRYSPEDLVTAADTNQEHADFCKAVVEKSGGAVHNEGPYTPYILKQGNATRMTVLFPGSIGGVNWGGYAIDPTMGYVFVNTMDEASIGWMEERTNAQGVKSFARNSVLGNPARFQWSDNGPGKSNLYPSGERAWPCQKPPWGAMIAVNANTGDIAWKVVLGVTDDLPEGKKNTGRYSMGGPMTTAGGLVFIAATNDKRFRAFDSKTGRELWVTTLPVNAHAVPMTYQGKDGKQYVAITAGGNSALDNPPPAGSEALIVYTLP
jgi:quinoprotein glucose dehydrogenase